LSLVTFGIVRIVKNRSRTRLTAGGVLFALLTPDAKLFHEFVQSWAADAQLDGRASNLAIVLPQSSLNQVSLDCLAGLPESTPDNSFEGFRLKLLLKIQVIAFQIGNMECTFENEF